MAGKTAPTNAPQVTPEERAAKRADARARRIQRDRKRRLTDVSAALKLAGEAIAEGNVSSHDAWLNQARRALDAYADYVTLTVGLGNPEQDNPDPMSTW